MVGFLFDFLVRSTRFLRRRQKFADVFSWSYTKTRSDGGTILAQNEGGSSLSATQLPPSALLQPCTHTLSGPPRSPSFQLRLTGAVATMEPQIHFPAEFRRGKRLRAAVSYAQTSVLGRKQFVSSRVRSSWACSSVRRHLLSAAVCDNAVPDRVHQHSAYPSSSSASSVHCYPRRRPDSAAWSVFPCTPQPNSAIRAGRANNHGERDALSMSAPRQPLYRVAGTVFPGTCPATLSPLHRRESRAASHRTVCDNALASRQESHRILAPARLFVPAVARGSPTILSANAHVVHRAQLSVRFTTAVPAVAVPVTGRTSTATDWLKQPLTIGRRNDGASTEADRRHTEEIPVSDGILTAEDRQHKEGILSVKVVRHGTRDSAADSSRQKTNNGRLDDDPVPVLIDVHEERLLELAAKANKIDGVKFIRTALKMADVVIGHPPHEIMIERKTTQDLFFSLQDKRLYNQLNAIFSHTQCQRHRSLLALEGSFANVQGTLFARACASKSNRRDSRVTEREVKRAVAAEKAAFTTMVNLAVRNNISVLRTWNTEETFRLITVIAQNFNKLVHPDGTNSEIEDEIRYHHAARRKVSDETLFRFALETVPGISSSVARLLLRDVKPRTFYDVIDRLGKADSIQFLTASCGATSPVAQRLVKLLCRPDCDALTRQQFIDRLTAVRGVTLAKSRKMAEESLETLKSRRFEGFGLTTRVRKQLCAMFDVEFEPNAELANAFHAIPGISLPKSRLMAQEPLEHLKKRAFSGFDLPGPLRLHLCSIFGAKCTDFRGLQELGLTPQEIAKVARRFVTEEELAECFRSAPNLFDINIPQAAVLCKLYVPDALALRRWEYYERIVRKGLSKKMAKEVCRACPDALPPKTQLHQFVTGKLASSLLARLYDNDD